jgi:hypothetical protein
MDLVIFNALVYVGEPVTLRLPWVTVYIIIFVYTIKIQLDLCVISHLGLHVCYQMAEHVWLQ